MTEDIRHLHKDNDTSYCDQDISHLLATFEPTGATCEPCLNAFEAHKADLQAQISKHEEDMAGHDDAEHKLRAEQEELLERSHANMRRLQELHDEISKVNEEHTKDLHKNRDIAARAQSLASERGTTASALEVAKAQLEKLEK